MEKILVKAFALITLLTCLTSLLGATAVSNKTNDGDNSVKLNASYEIMSFNIRTDVDGGQRAWSYRGEYLMDYIREHGADVVALQEVKRSQFSSIKASLSDVYQMIYFERDTAADPEGLAILYSYEFELVKGDVFWLSETPDVMSKGWDADYHRICVHALLRSCYGNYLDVYNTHLEWAGERARNEGLRLIVDRASESQYPSIICGDFNAPEDEDTYDIIGSRFNDTAKLAPVSDSGWTAHDWGLFDPEWSKPIDFIFTSKNIKVDKFDILQDVISEGVYYSDHYAVTAKLNYDYVLKYVD